MQAVILAAGEGIRMRPLTLERPKALVEVGGKPLLEHMLDALPDGVSEVIIVVGYKGDMIRERFGENFKGRSIKYIDQPEKTGTAHALRMASSLLRAGEQFLVSYADDLHDKESIGKLLEYPLSLLTREVLDPEKFGVVEIDEAGKILDIIEKPKNPATNLAAIGVYLLDDRIFAYQPDQHETGEFYLTTMIEKMVKEHDVFAVPSSFWLPVGYPDDLAIAEKILEEKRQ